MTRGLSPFLAWSDFHERSRFARSTIPEEKWGTTRSLKLSGIVRKWPYFPLLPGSVKTTFKAQTLEGSLQAR